MYYVIKASTIQSEQLNKSAASGEGKRLRNGVCREDRKKEEMKGWTAGRRGQGVERKGGTEGTGWRKVGKDLGLVNGIKKKKRENMGR